MKDDIELVEPGILWWMSTYWECVGRNVVILGGTIEGCGMAGFLADRGRNVILVDKDKILGGEPLMRFSSLQKVSIKPEVRYWEITDKALVVTTKDGERQTIEADALILASSPKLNTDLQRLVERKVPEVYLVGVEDKEPGCIMNAIGNGYRIAGAL